MRPLANRLSEKGFTVSVPLLAGHGTTKEQLAATSWEDWYQGVEDEFRRLHDKHALVFVAGLSLGGLLTLKLLEDHPQAVAAFACLATPLFLKRWVEVLVPLVHKGPFKPLYPYQKKGLPDVKDPNARDNYWSNEYMPVACINSLMNLQKIVNRDLSKIIAPALLMHSRYDSTAPYQSMSAIAQKLSSKITETITLENSFHLITIDYDKDVVANKTAEFFTRFLNQDTKD